MPIPSVTLKRYDGFVEFAKQSGKRTIAGSIDGMGVVKATDKFDFIGNIGRGSGARDVNKNIRAHFLDTIVKMCGVSNKDMLPESVKAAMKLEDYNDKGKPLTARRIIAVSKAVERHVDSFAIPIMSRACALGEKADVELKERIKVAVKTCIDDADVLDVVEKGILGIILEDGVAHHTGKDTGFRSADDIAAKVAEIAANVDELRRAANGDKAILEAGKRCLAGINGRAVTFPPGQFRIMIGNVAAGVAALKNSSFKANIRNGDADHLIEATREFEQALDAAMGTRADLYEPSEGDTDAIVCRRNFLTGLILQKCDAELPQLVRGALRSDSAETVKGVYQGIISERTGANGEATVRGKQLCELEIVQSHSRRMDYLFAGASCMCPPDTSVRLPPDMSRATVGAKPNPRDWGGLGKLRESIAAETQRKMEDNQERYLSLFTGGSGVGHDIFKLAFTRKMNDVYPPSKAMPGYFTDGITHVLGRGLAGKAGNAIDRLKAVATQKSAFKEACAKAEITIGGVRISHDIDEARKQIAMFLNLNPSKLGDADKLKIEAIISLITKGVAEAAFKGPAVGLNPAFDPRNGAPADGTINPAFDFEAKDKPGCQKIALTRNENGDVTFDFTGYRELTKVKVLSDNGAAYTELDVRPLPDDGYSNLAMHYGIGSSLDVRFQLTLGATALNRIAAGGAIKVGDQDVSCTRFSMNWTIHDPEAGSAPRDSEGTTTARVSTAKRGGRKSVAPKNATPDEVKANDSPKHKNVFKKAAGKFASLFHHES